MMNLCLWFQMWFCLIYSINKTKYFKDECIICKKQNFMSVEQVKFCFLPVTKEGLFFWQDVLSQRLSWFLIDSRGTPMTKSKVFNGWCHTIFQANFNFLTPKHTSSMVCSWPFLFLFCWGDPSLQQYRWDTQTTSWSGRSTQLPGLSLALASQSFPFGTDPTPSLTHALTWE